jgi:hypothetical protein
MVGPPGGVGVTGGELIEEHRAQDFYRRLRARLDKWLRSREGRAYRFADHLLLLPDFVHLTIRLALDRRVPMELRTQTAAVLAYVMLPLDLVAGLMETIRTILDAAEEMVGHRVWKRLQRIVGGRSS